MNETNDIQIKINELLRGNQFGQLQNLLLNNYSKQLPIQDLLNALNLMLERGYAEKMISIVNHLLNIRTEYNLLMLLGKAESITKNYNRAFEAYSKALDLNPDSINAIFNLGVVRQNQGITEEAIEFFNKVIAAKNNIPEAYYNLGNIYRTLKHFSDAEIFYKKCLDISLQNSDCNYNLGVVLEKQFKFDEALKHYNRAITINPNFVNAHWNKALLLLTLGNYKEGWQEYEWRLQKKEYQRNDLPFRYWNGENLNYKKLLVYDEQGFGDTFQFVRFVESLKDEYAVEISFDCKEEIYSLFKNYKNFGNVFVRGENTYSKEKFDFKVSLMSLPFLLHIDHEIIAITKPYIETEPENKSLPDVVTERLKVGFVWQGNPEHKNDKNRSVEINKCISAYSNPHIQLYSLQKRNEENKSVDEILKKYKVIDLNNRIRNFNDTAKLLTQLDLIISVDTSVAHLAGALMKPVWILLAANPDWRWGLSGQTSAWYPTVRLFRQKELGKWDNVLESISTELSKIISERENPDIEKMIKAAFEYFNIAMFDKAAEIFEKIISINKSDETVFNNLAICYQKLGLFNQAIVNSTAAIKINENYVIAYNTLALNYFEIGKSQKAIETLNCALEKNPLDGDTIFNLANIFHHEGNVVAAKKYYEQAYKLKNCNSNLIYNYALLLTELRDYETARKVVNKAGIEYPDEPHLLFLSGNIEKYYEKFESAGQFYLRVIRINPDYLEAYINLANTYYLIHRFNEAIEIYNLLIKKGIKDGRIDYSLGVISLEKKDYNLAETQFRDAIVKDENNADFHIALSEVLFTKGDYKNGWKEFDWRFKKEEFKNKKNIMPNKLTDLTDKNILIYEEQGIGDTFQFIRFVKQIKSSKNKITFSARKEIRDLLAGLNYVDEVVDSFVEVNKFDYVFSLMSMGKYFVHEFNDIENVGTYIYSKNISTETAEHFLSKNKLNIGFCWRGNVFPVHNRKRHAELGDFECLFSNKTAVFFSLQKDITEEEKSILKSYENVVDLSFQLTTFNETAAFCSQMDLIISVDTAVLHLAGAMGKTAWGLLAFSPDWRWQPEINSSRWYPNTKLFRQKNMFEWDGVFNKIGKELEIFEKGN